MKWKTTETLPKNQSNILISWDNLYSIGWYQPWDNRWISVWYSWLVEAYPTYWAKLPKKP